ncbi:hypothetical protein D3C71_1590340 [compost metagenome]
MPDISPGNLLGSEIARLSAQVVLDLLPDGRVRMKATCSGQPDARYAAMAAERVPVEVAWLLSELGERVINGAATAKPEVAHG